MASELSGYELVDFGDGRKLEWIGSLLLDRPSVAAETSRASPSAKKPWNEADLVFEGDWRGMSEQGKSALQNGWNATLNTSQGDIDWSLKPTPAGHIGLFPEHLHSFDFVLCNSSHQKRSASVDGDPNSKPKALNLFAYTGFGSVQCALGGFAVTHVDASKPAVQWAKRNLELNTQFHESLTSSVRYLVDDAMAFAQRELRRGNQYDLICLDPPAYGHGPQGKAWRIDRDLPLLLEILCQLLSDRPIGIMLSGHSDPELIHDIAESRKLSQLYARLPRSQFDWIHLRSTAGRNLNFGYRQLWLA